MDSYLIAAIVAKYLLMRPVLVISVGIITFLAAWLTARLLKVQRLTWWKPAAIVLISYVIALSIMFATNPLILKVDIYTRLFIAVLLLLITSIGASKWVLKNWKYAVIVGIAVAVVSAAVFVALFVLAYELGDYAFRAAQTA